MALIASKQDRMALMICWDHILFFNLLTSDMVSPCSGERAIPDGTLIGIGGTKQRFNAFTFFDYGWVSDDIDLNASSYSAYSTGLGLSASYKNLYASLTLGIPLKKEYEFTTKKVSNTRFDFVMSATF